MTSKFEFVEISNRDLSGVEMLLETGYTHDWNQVFVHSDKGYSTSQFNEPEDLTDDRRIRINAQLAIKIWAQVEAVGMKNLIKNENKAEKIFLKEYRS